MIYQQTNRSSFIGKAGEHAVASELLSRFIDVAFPTVDSGVDLIAGGKVRIQVKTSNRSPLRPSGYVFGLGHKRLGKSTSKKALRDWSKEVDFLICYGLDEKRCWILPSSVLTKYPTVESLCLGTQHHGVVDSQKVYDLLDSGMKQCEVARVMGIHPVTVSEHARGNRKNLKNKNFSHILAVEADKYENAWHEIEAAVNLANEIDDIDSLLSLSEIEHATEHFAAQENF